VSTDQSTIASERAGGPADLAGSRGGHPDPSPPGPSATHPAGRRNRRTLAVFPVLPLAVGFYAGTLPDSMLRSALMTTVAALSIVGILLLRTGTRLLDSVPDRSLDEREISEREISEREISEREISEREISEREISEREISEREISERDISERELAHRMSHGLVVTLISLLAAMAVADGVVRKTTAASLVDGDGWISITITAVLVGVMIPAAVLAWRHTGDPVGTDDGEAASRPSAR
jgi:hypothetical protein